MFPIIFLVVSILFVNSAPSVVINFGKISYAQESPSSYEKQIDLQGKNKTSNIVLKNYSQILDNPKDSSDIELEFEIDELNIFLVRIYLNFVQVSLKTLKIIIF